MNKLMTVALIAGALTLLDAPEALAHKELRGAYQPPAYQRQRAPAVRKMPAWLKQDRAFRKWYKQSRLQRNRYLGWRQIVRIYRWERLHRLEHRRAYRHVRNVGFYRNDVRKEKRNKRRRQS